ncbi:MAG: Stp1/IreP family PP2C-type Ser/Thr phosphatase [Bacilli bacterium]
MNVNSCELFALTDIGKKRPNNEDQAGLFNGDEFKAIIIADGMGGHSAGEVASSIAVNTIIKMLSLTPKPENITKAKKMLHKIVKKANSSIHKLAISKSRYYGMGTTLVLALLLDEKTLIINCGDSRAYTYKRDGNQFKRITYDQTVVQYLYSMGSISKSEMLTSPKRHVLMNAMGISNSIDYDTYEIDNDYDLLLCCSDGLTNMVPDEDIKKIIEENIDGKIEVLTQKLMDAALDNGGVDNISISVLEAK